MNTPGSDTDFQTAHAWATEALPWRLNNTLSRHDIERFEAHLAQCENCRASMKAEQTLIGDLQRRPLADHMPQGSLRKLNSRIDDFEKPPAKNHGRNSPGQSPHFPIWARVAMAAQAAVIAVLAIATFWPGSQPGPTNGYATLSSKSAIATPRIQVVFADHATVEQIRTVLASLNATIVSGPSEAGLFEVRFDNADDGLPPADPVLAQLRASPHVVFAARAPN